jgi:hypothetical protein
MLAQLSQRRKKLSIEDGAIGKRERRQATLPACARLRQLRNAGEDLSFKLVALVLLCLMTGTAVAQEPKVTSLMNIVRAFIENKSMTNIASECRSSTSSAIMR